MDARILSIVARDVADDTVCTFNHFENASTITNNILPINGTA